MSDTVTVKVLRPFQDGGGADAQMIHPGAMLTCLRTRAADLAANGLVEKPGEPAPNVVADPQAEIAPIPADAITAETAAPRAKAKASR